MDETICESIPAMASSNDLSQFCPVPVFSIMTVKRFKKLELLRKDNIYQCSLCNFKTHKRCILTGHFITHVGSQPFSCELCDRKFSFKSSRDRHYSVHKTGDKRVECDVCDFVTSSKQYLTTHSYSHTGERPYSCTLCDFTTITGGNLRGHMRTHTGETPYDCSLCPYKAKTSGLISRHMLTHKIEKRLKCTECEFKTDQRSDLVRHTRCHTGEKPYACEHCPYRASAKLCVQKHTLRKHSTAASSALGELG